MPCTHCTGYTQSEQGNGWNRAVYSEGGTKIEYAVAAALAALIIVLLITLLNKGKTENKKSREGRTPALRHCPICGSPLSKGEKVKSVLYPGEIDRMMEIYGCPHCYPPSPALPRICPVCHKSLPSSGIIYARYFQRKERAHVHVLGCSGCYTRRSSIRQGSAGSGPARSGPTRPGSAHSESDGKS
ncbi:MAG: hypothetical protein ACLFNZ_03215 [Spirochaetaceae bacterium]